MSCGTYPLSFHNGQPHPDGVRKTYEGIISNSSLGIFGLI